MSVLFKALEKAARQNAEAQDPAGPAGAAYAGMPGALPPFVPERRRGRIAVRVLGLGFVGVTAVVVGGLFVMGDDVERMLTDAMNPAPVYAPVRPPAETVQPVVEPEPAPAATEVAAVPPAEPMVPEPAAEPEAVAAPEPAAADPALPAPVADAEAPVDPADDIALLMQEGAARRAAAEGRTPSAEPTIPAVAPPAALAPVGPERLSMEDALSARQGGLDRATLSAPITVGRDAGASGTAAVTVSTMPMDTQASLAEAYTSLVRGNYGEALAGYTTVAQREPGNVAALAGQAAALHKLRRLPEAQAAYEKVLALQPDNREALTNMITLIGDSAPRDAIRRLEALQAQAPDFSPVSAQLGMLYARMGDVDRASGALRRAIALSPQNPLYHYNLAVVNDRAGRRGEAAQAYEQVLRLVGSGGGGGIAAQPIRDRLIYLRARP